VSVALLHHNYRQIKEIALIKPALYHACFADFRQNLYVLRPDKFTGNRRPHRPRKIVPADIEFGD